ncbi:MAG: hypothetical protein ABSD31_09905 [Candidatus Binataceae bacterium]
MSALDAINVQEISSWELLALQSFFLEAVGAGRHDPVLMTYGLAGRAVSLGRYHLYGGPETNRGVDVYRRLTGGRIAGAGQGWLGCALILPSRDLLPPQEAPALKPEQVINRCVRGVLTGLRNLGVDSFYPGRDAVTVARREIAVCSLETNSSGALLFEAGIAIDRGLEALVDDLELLDPEGSLTCPMYSAEATTTITRELGRDVSSQEVAAAVESGYEAMFGRLGRREFTAAERAQAKGCGAELAAAGWLTSRRHDPSLTMVGRERIQLGFAEARLALNDAGTIERVMITGDLIANSGGLAEFERELSGKRLDLISVSAAVAKTYADGANYILGMGDLTNLSRLIMKAS